MQRRLHVVSLPWTMTRCWLSACGEKTCDFFVGTVVFHGTGDIMTPPTLSMHRVSGATSRRRTLSVFSSEPPARMLAWTAAPDATASSGLIDLFGSFPLKKSFRSRTTFRIRVDPPTRTTLWIAP